MTEMFRNSNRPSSVCVPSVIAKRYRSESVLDDAVDSNVRIL